MVSAPQIALLAAIGSAMYSWPTKTLPKECQSKYCTTEMWVDKPMNTLLKDQSLGVGLGRPAYLPGPQTVEMKVQSDYIRAMMQSPGVGLVAHAIAVA